MRLITLTSTQSSTTLVPVDNIALVIREPEGEFKECTKVFLREAGVEWVAVRETPEKIFELINAAP